MTGMPFRLFRLAMSDEGISFGPLPSRRLGRGPGIDDIPPKSCSYSCVYCHVGRAPTKTIALRQSFRPEEIVATVSRRMREIQQRGGAAANTAYEKAFCLDPATGLASGNLARLTRVLGSAMPQDTRGNRHPRESEEG